MGFHLCDYRCLAIPSGQQIRKTCTYKYWLNNNTAAIQTVTLDAAVNPYTLIALLPMQQEPIRSTCFHFETKDGQPMVYAKNDFRIRFCDAAGYWMDDSRQFIDNCTRPTEKHMKTWEWIGLIKDFPSSHLRTFLTRCEEVVWASCSPMN